MSLETAIYIGDLVKANPAPSDQKSQGDDHLRMLKGVLLSCFAGFGGPVLVTAADTGTANTYVLTTSNPVPAYVVNMMVILRPTNSSTSTVPTVNVSALGAKTIKAVDGNALLPGDLAAGQTYAMIYDGTAFRLTQITKNYADQLSFAGVLPAQPGGLPQYELTTQNNAASWTPRPAAVSLAAYKLGAL